MGTSLVSAGAKVGWFGVEVGRWMRSLRLSTSTTAASLISRKRKVSNLATVLVAGSDQQHTQADDLVESVRDALRRPRIGHAG